jgi:hypothetical protein
MKRAGLACAVAVGGELVDAKSIADGRFDIIEERARQYLAVIAKARELYGKALAGGVSEAKFRLEALQQ